MKKPNDIIRTIYKICFVKKYLGGINNNPINKVKEPSIKIIEVGPENISLDCMFVIDNALLVDIIIAQDKMKSMNCDWIDIIISFDALNIYLS